MKDKTFFLAIIISVLAFLLFGCAAPQEIGSEKGIEKLHP